MRGFTRFALALSLVTLIPALGSGQGRPSGWLTRFDAGAHAGHGADSLVFEDMKPGFHVTTGPAVTLWHPDSVHIFPASQRRPVHHRAAQGRQHTNARAMDGSRRDLQMDTGRGLECEKCVVGESGRRDRAVSGERASRQHAAAGDGQT